MIIETKLFEKMVDFVLYILIFLMYIPKYLHKHIYLGNDNSRIIYTTLGGEQNRIFLGHAI